MMCHVFIHHQEVFGSEQVRDDRYRFTVWVPMVNATQRVDWTRVAAYELYDLHGDTGSDFDFDGYSKNIASAPEHASLIASKSAALQKVVETWY